MVTVGIAISQQTLFSLSLFSLSRLALTGFPVGASPLLS